MYFLILLSLIIIIINATDKRIKVQTLQLMAWESLTCFLCWEKRSGTAELIIRGTAPYNMITEMKK